MHRHTNSTRLISNSTSHTLANPPSRIGRKFKSALRVKFINRAKKSNISFLYQIEKSKSAAHIFFGNRNHKTKIGLCKTLSRILISLLNKFSESCLFIPINKLKTTNFIQIHSHRIIRNISQVNFFNFFSRILKNIILIKRIYKFYSKF